MSKLFKETGLYIISFLLCSAILFNIFEGYKIDLSVPLYYSGGDDFYWLATFKGQLENGWLTQSNPLLGAPTVADWSDFYNPTTAFPVLVLKFINCFTCDYLTSVNVYFLLSFILSTFTSIFVFRWCGLDRSSALAGSLLFSFLLYKFARNTGHITLSTALFIIPLCVLVMVWLSEREGLFFYRYQQRQTPKSFFTKSLVSLLVCIMLPMMEVYYAFFACYLFVVTGIYASLYKRSFYPLLASGILVIAVVMTLLMLLLPNIMYIIEHGINPQHRSHLFWEAELYGLKISHLLLPSGHHRIPLLADIATQYNSQAPLTTENQSASLGVIASIGFLFLLFNLLFNRKTQSLVNNKQLVELLSVLNFSAVLLGTIGGFGVLFNFFISSDIRAYNRIVVFIAFFSLLASFILFSHVIKSLVLKHYRGRIGKIIMLIILTLGILDQTPRSSSGLLPNHVLNQKMFLSDKAFIKEIEQNSSTGAMIYQLPYMRFPEAPPVNSLPGYGLLLGYLHSNTLRWSFGNFRGRPGDSQQQNLSGLPLSQQIAEISLLGFNGIYIDRFGYADNGADIVAKIAALLEETPIESDNKRLVFFTLKKYNHRVMLMKWK